MIDPTNYQIAVELADAGGAGVSQRPERGRADRRAAGASEGDLERAHPADAGITRSAALAD
jgi:hypothetical protein